jgi:tellurite resistance protein
MAGFLYHSINGGSISVFFIKFKSKKFRNSIAMDVATSNRLSAIDAEMRQIQETIQNRRRTLNLFLRNIRAVDSAAADERIRTSAANIRNFELRLEVLRKELLELILEAVSRLSHSVTDRED